MRRLVLTLALLCAAACSVTLSDAATTREEAGQLIKRYYERHPEAARPTDKSPAGPLTTHSPAGPSTKQPLATDVSSRVLGKRYVWFDNGRKMGVIAFGTGGFAYDDWLHVPQAWSVAPNGDLIVSSDSSRWVTRLTLDPATGRFSGGRDRTSKTQDGTRSELVPVTPPRTATNAALPPPSPSGPSKVPGAVTTLPAPSDSQKNPKVPVPPTATAPIPPQPQTTQQPAPPSAPPPAATNAPYGVTPQCKELFNRGLEHTKAGNQQGAIRLYGEVLAQCPRTCPAMNNMGSAYNSIGNRSNAKIWFEAAVRCDPKNQTFKTNATAISPTPAQPQRPPQPASPPTSQIKPAGGFDGVYVGMAEYEGRKIAKLTWKVSGSRITVTSEKDTSKREFVGVVRPSGDFVIEFPNNTYSGRISGKSLAGTFRLHKGVLGGKGSSGTFSANR